MAAPLTKRGMAPCSTISLQPGKPSLESPLSKTDPYFGTWGGLALIQKEIRVGIVGADARASWAKVPHVPAIKGLPGLKLVAVATRNERSAREAAEAFGADRWFSDPFAMLRDDRIDVVTIAARCRHTAPSFWRHRMPAKRSTARRLSDAPSRRPKRWRAP